MLRPFDSVYDQFRFLRAKYLAYFHWEKFQEVKKQRTELKITV